MTLGKKLINLRGKRNLSQSEIAEFLDVSQSTYHKWESDKSKPSIDNLIKISEFHEIDISDLLSDLSNFVFTKNKFNNSYITGSTNNSTININSSEIINSVIENQKLITSLIQNQNELFIKFIDSKSI